MCTIPFHPLLRVLSSSFRVLSFISGISSIFATFSNPGDNSSTDLTISSSAGLSDSCTTAYAKSIPCDDWLIMGLYRSGDSSTEEDKFSNATLDALCTTQYLDGLRQWRDTLMSDCSSTDIQKINKEFKASSSEGLMILQLAMETTSSFVEFLYWPTCMKDLNTGVFCYLDASTSSGTDWASSNDTENTPEMISTFCNSSCATQMSVFSWEISGKVYGASEINIGDATKLCPNLDTSKFPFLHSTSSPSSSSSSLSSGNTTTMGGANSTSKNATSIVGTSAAGALGAGNLIWGVSSTMLAVTVGLGML